MDDTETEQPFIQCSPQMKYVLNKPVASYVTRIDRQYPRTTFLPVDLTALTQEQALAIISRFCDGTVTATCALKNTSFPVGLSREFTKLDKLSQIILWDEFTNRIHEVSPVIGCILQAISRRALASAPSTPNELRVLAGTPAVLQRFAHSGDGFLSFENAAARDLHLAILETLKPEVSLPGGEAEKSVKMPM